MMRFLLASLFPLVSMALQGAGLDLPGLPRPPLPPDPFEFVTGDALPVQDAQQRIAALALLEKARGLSNLRSQPYALRTTFSASGGLTSDGNWVLEDIAPKGGGYRWTAQGPNFSALNLYPGSTANGLYGNQPGGVLPLRLLQVRAAIFFVLPNVGPQASIRTASGVLNGVPQNCVLLAFGAGKRSFTGGRNWEESEYCVSSQTGLLSQYSPAPGLFVRYDYSSGLRFHEKFIPTAFTIGENGHAVAEARTVSVSDPPARTDAMFDTAGLTPVGAGRAMNPGANMILTVPVPGQPFPTTGANAAIRPVTLHGLLASDGTLRDIEILATSDPGLNQTAIAQAKSFAQGRAPSQPGATPQSSEFLLTLEFVTATN